MQDPSNMLVSQPRPWPVPRRKSPHTTSRDVAALAGVSQSAVSRCFTPGASVSDETRQRVLQIAEEIGYRPNAHARNLITGRTRMVGVVLAHLDNLFYPRFLQLLTERLQTLGMQVLLFVADASREGELMGQLLNYRVDGIVLAATTLNTQLAKACTDAGIPVVLFNRVPAHDLDQAFHSVQTDQVHGMRELTQLLIEQGHRRVAYLAGHLSSSTNQARERGFKAAMGEADLPVFAYGVGDYEEAQARCLVKEWFTQDGRARPLHECPDAIVAADDRMALAALDTLRHELGLKVPQQVSVVGFDDVPTSAWPSYDLTTFSQPLPDMIDAVLNLLTAQLQTRDTGAAGKQLGQAILLQGTLQRRGSTAPRPGFTP